MTKCWTFVMNTILTMPKSFPPSPANKVLQGSLILPTKTRYVTMRIVVINQLLVALMSWFTMTVVSFSCFSLWLILESLTVLALRPVRSVVGCSVVMLALVTGFSSSSSLLKKHIRGTFNRELTIRTRELSF